MRFRRMIRVQRETAVLLSQKPPHLLIHQKGVQCPPGTQSPSTTIPRRHTLFSELATMLRWYEVSLHKLLNYTCNRLCYFSPLAVLCFYIWTWLANYFYFGCYMNEWLVIVSLKRIWNTVNTEFRTNLYLHMGNRILDGKQVAELW